jgi:hypothetical protein
MATYVPIVRGKAYERDAVSSFGGLSSFSSDDGPPAQLLPLAEITDASDLSYLSRYKNASGVVLVDLPIYLTEDFNAFQGSVEEVLEDFGSQTQFYIDNESQIDTPVVSGRSEMPVDYSNLLERYEELKTVFDQVAVRIFVRGSSLGGTQKEVLSELNEALESGESVMFDVYDVQEYGGNMTDNLQWMVGEFANQEKYILNSPYEATSENRGLFLMEQLDIDGFGDFITNSRFTYPSGSSEGSTISHYFPSNRELREYEQQDYGEARRELVNEPDWDPHHCEYCEKAEGMDDRRDTGDDGDWGLIATGHYIHSILYDNFGD